jgi:hypothetical protein
MRVLAACWIGLMVGASGVCAQGADGPVLELGGLPDPAAAAPPPARGGPTVEVPSDARFDGRTEATATLSERAASIVDRTTLGGYGEHEYRHGEDDIPTFVNHRYVLFVYSRLHKRISTATEIEFEFAGSPGKKDGVLGVGEVLLEFSVVDFMITEWLNFRAGVILVPVGAYNVRHDGPTRDLIDRPLAYTTVVPSTWFESGAGFHGKVGLGDHRLSYEIYAVNGLDARIYDGNGLRGARGSHLEDNNPDKALTGRIAYSPALSFEVAASGFSGEYDLNDNRVNIGALDLLWKSGAWEINAEAVRVVIDEGFVEGFSSSSVANTRDAVPTDMWGYFAEAAWHFQVAPGLFPADLKDNTFTLALRYEGKDTDMDRDSAAGDKRRLTLGLNFRPIEAFVLKTDYQLETSGVEDDRAPAEVWSGDFWSGDHRARFAFAAAVAYLF